MTDRYFQDIQYSQQYISLQSLGEERGNPVDSNLPPSAHALKSKIKTKFRTAIDRFSKVFDYLGISITTRTGWRGGILVGCCISCVVLISNLGLLLIGALSHGGYHNGIGTLAKGKEARVDYWNTVYHLLVNILSTALLTSSSYCSQILCAPTRPEIDAAHQRGVWLDVGILSTRNMRYIGRKRAFLGALLIVSSIPLHLFYNSAIFKVAFGQSYKIHFVNATDTANISDMIYANKTANGTVSYDFNLSYTNLTNSAWKSKYSTRTLVDIGDLYLVADQVGVNITFPKDKAPCPSVDPSWSLNDVGYLSSSFNTLEKPMRIAYYLQDHNFNYCNGSRFQWPQEILMNGKNWSLPTTLAFDGDSWVHSLTPPLHIAYGLAVSRTTGSEVQISLHFMIIVIICNLGKLIAMLWTLKISSNHPIITVGDAISSFLEIPDPTTAGMCTLDKDATLYKGPPPGTLEVCDARRIEILGEQHWKSQIVMFVLFADLSFSAIISTASITIGARTWVASDRDMSWGTASNHQLWSAPSAFQTQGVLLSIFLANCPQIMLSMAYISLNRLYTSMSFEREWAGYAKHRKGLRVTRPRGEQRSTYFLQLPYRLAVPLTVTAGALHWLLSQSLFLSRLDFRDYAGNLAPSESKSSTGFSPFSGLLFGLTFIGLFFGLLSLLLVKDRYHTPIALHCSLVISAACHPAPEEGDPHLKPVQWGVTVRASRRRAGHCTFSSEEVGLPKPGKPYS